MGREFEVKYRLTEAAFAALSQEYAPFREIKMETTYYDTPALALSAKKWTLRQRYENGVSVCTLKTPSPDGGRGEWEVRCPDIADAPEKLIALGAPEELPALAADLRPLCAAQFVRLAADISYGESRLELALDRGKLLGGDREAPIFEVEAELKAGQDADVLAFGAFLESTYGLTLEHKSKFKRARDLALEGR